MAGLLIVFLALLQTWTITTADGRIVSREPVLTAEERRGHCWFTEWNASGYEPYGKTFVLWWTHKHDVVDFTLSPPRVTVHDTERIERGGLIEMRCPAPFSPYGVSFSRYCALDATQPPVIGGEFNNTGELVRCVRAKK